MLLIFTIKVAFLRSDEENLDEPVGWTWWPPRSEHRKVYDFNRELDVISTPYLPLFLPSAFPFALTNLPTNAHSLSELHETLHLFILPLSTTPTTPTPSLSPTPPVYLFFHQIELAESKGIPTIPSQSWVRERERHRRWKEVECSSDAGLFMCVLSWGLTFAWT